VGGGFWVLWVVGFRWLWFFWVEEFVKMGCGKRDYRATSPRVDDRPFHCLILPAPPLCSVTVTAADGVYRSPCRYLKIPVVLWRWLASTGLHSSDPRGCLWFRGRRGCRATRVRVARTAVPALSDFVEECSRRGQRTVFHV
jgi:hypothetical protein